MDYSSAVFYFFSFILLFSAIKVITARNPIFSALFLVLSFFSAAGLWLLLQAEFLAIALVLVYVGAVMVLFLFVIMMIDINVEVMKKGFWNYFPAIAFVSWSAFGLGFILGGATTGFDVTGFGVFCWPTFFSGASGITNAAEMYKGASATRRTSSSGHSIKNKPIIKA